MSSRSHEPSPLKRRMMVKAAKRLMGECPSCRIRRPLHPDTGNCWPCDHLTENDLHAGADLQQVPRGEMCNDCAFRPGSPESKQSPDYEMANAHLAREGDSENSPQCTLDKVIDAARGGGGIFWCHKPMLEPEQVYGYDAGTRELVPLYMEGHWRACEGWRRVFDRTWSTKAAEDSTP